MIAVTDNASRDSVTQSTADQFKTCLRRLSAKILEEVYAVRAFWHGKTKKSKMKMIIAEDFEVVRSVLRNLLSQINGVALTGEFASAESAIAGVRDNPPDAVLLDIQINSGSGMKSCRWCRRNTRKSRFSLSPTILMRCIVRAICVQVLVPSLTRAVSSACCAGSCEN